MHAFYSFFKNEFKTFHKYPQTRKCKAAKDPNPISISLTAEAHEKCKKSGAPR